MAVIKVSLFAEQERETKLDKIGDALSNLAEHVDFAALAAEESTRQRRGLGVTAVAARRSRPS